MAATTPTPPAIRKAVVQGLNRSGEDTDLALKTYRETGRTVVIIGGRDVDGWSALTPHVLTDLRRAGYEIVDVYITGAGDTHVALREA